MPGAQGLRPSLLPLAISRWLDMKRCSWEMNRPPYRMPTLQVEISLPCHRTDAEEYCFNVNQSSFIPDAAHKLTEHPEINNGYLTLETIGSKILPGYLGLCSFTHNFFLLASSDIKICLFLFVSSNGPRHHLDSC